MKKCFCGGLVILFFLLQLTGCVQPAHVPGQPYYVPPAEAQDVSRQDPGLIEAFPVPYALFCGETKGYTELFPEKQGYEFFEKYGLGQRTSRLFESPFDNYVTRCYVTEAEYKALSAAYLQYLKDLIPSVAADLFPAVRNIQFRVQGEDQFLTSFRITIREGELPKGFRWSDSEEWYALRDALLDISTAYNEFRSAERSQDLKIEIYGNRGVLFHEIITGDTRYYKMPNAVFGLSDENRSSLNAKELAEIANAYGARQIILLESPYILRPETKKGVVYASLSGEARDALIPSLIESVKANIQKGIPEDSWIQSYDFQWNGAHTGIAAVLIYVDSAKIPSEQWLSAEGSKIHVLHSRSYALWINDVLDYEVPYPNGIKTCFIDMETRETLAAWQDALEDGSARIQ